MRLHHGLIVLAIAAPVRARAQGATTPTDAAPPARATTRIALPVQSVTLFSSGVGYFEHAGTVHGNATAELRFTTAQINDVLKSLTLQDFDGGRIGAVTYPSQDPVSRTLRSFDVDLTGNPAMASLLNQLRGARITVVAHGASVTGTILGVESRRTAVDQGMPVETPVLNVVTGATIRSIELPAVTSLSLDDARLQQELSRALEALNQARDQDRKPVEIDFTGRGDRRVRVGYVVETPIWKASYRLLLGEHNARLQGWAIVDNQTDGDWTNITLSLVSGRPESFIMDLYRPLYVQRDTVVADLYRGLHPQLYAPGIPTGSARNLPAAPGGVRSQAPTLGLAVNAFEDARVAIGAASSGFGSAAGGVADTAVAAMRLGTLFHYTIPDVTLARRQSALLPIVVDTVPIERVAIYNASVLATHPLDGVRLRNTTGKDLLQGPVTVLDSGSYAGDARIADLPAGDSRFLSYAVDLDVVVNRIEHPIVDVLIGAKISNGALLVKRKSRLVRVYDIDNRGKTDKTVIVEEPRTFAWSLADSAKPAETTASVYRFDQPVAAGRTAKLTVTQESNLSTTVELVPAHINTLLTYSQAGEVPVEVRNAIDKAVGLMRRVTDLRAQVASRDSSLAEVTREQQRIRDDMNAVDRASKYYQRLLAKLNDQESTIEQLQKERADLMTQRDAAQKALDEFVAGLTVG